MHIKRKVDKLRHKTVDFLWINQLLRPHGTTDSLSREATRGKIQVKIPLPA